MYVYNIEKSNSATHKYSIYIFFADDLFVSRFYKKLD
jgi:hypothetical protein